MFPPLKRFQSLADAAALPTVPVTGEVKPLACADRHEDRSVRLTPPGVTIVALSYIYIETYIYIFKDDTTHFPNVTFLTGTVMRWQCLATFLSL